MLTILYLFVYQTLCVFNMLMKSKISEARFHVRRTCNHVECQGHDTFRVSDTLCLQHAYEIKDFRSTMFRTDRFVTMLSTAGAIHYLQYYTYSCIRCFAPSTCLRNQRFRKHDVPMSKTS